VRSTTGGTARPTGDAGNGGNSQQRLVRRAAGTGEEVRWASDRVAELEMHLGRSPGPTDGGASGRGARARANRVVDRGVGVPEARLDETAETDGTCAVTPSA
jgi:hypothetical protein